MGMSTRAAIYVRVSRDFTGEHKAVERQREDCELTCELKNWKVVKVFEDNSVSAYRGKARPAYDQMIREYKSGKFDIIVAWKLDRLTRSTKGFAEMLDELVGQGLRICTGDLGEIDLSTADARFTAQILVNVAEFESARKSERMKRANLQRARKGAIKRGTRCFGYDGNFHVIEEEAELIRQIYDAYLNGASMSAISRSIAGKSDEVDISRCDAPSVIFAREKGKPEPELSWGLPVTQAILRNPRYAGYVAYNPTKDGKCKTPNSKWATYIMRDEKGEPVKAIWPAIVEADKWWAVQRRRNKNLYRLDGSPIERSGFPRKYFGSGVYRCGVCGGPMKSGDQSYRCDGHMSRMRDAVDRYVLKLIRARLASASKQLIPEYREDPLVVELSERIAKARGEIERARFDYKEHLIDGPMFKEINDEQSALIAQLEAKQLELLPEHPAAEVLAASDPVAAFDAIKDAGQIAAIINELCTVTLMPHKGGVKATAASLAKDVIVEWKV